MTTYEFNAVCRAAVLLTAWVCSGCGGRADNPEAAIRSDEPDLMASPTSIRILSGGGNCAVDCWFAIEVQSSGTLVLEDERGAEHFELTEDEFESVQAILARPDFLDALEDPDDCHNVPGYARSVAVTWPDETEKVDATAVSCTLTGGSHPYRLMYDRLLSLMSARLVCGANEVDQVRMLCRVQ